MTDAHLKEQIQVYRELVHAHEQMRHALEAHIFDLNVRVGKAMQAKHEPTEVEQRIKGGVEIPPPPYTPGWEEWCKQAKRKPTHNDYFRNKFLLLWHLLKKE